MSHHIIETTQINDSMNAITKYHKSNQYQSNPDTMRHIAQTTCNSNENAVNINVIVCAINIMMIPSKYNIIQYNLKVLVMKNVVACTHCALIGNIKNGFIKQEMIIYYISI